jgi:hypothetical protein
LWIEPEYEVGCDDDSEEEGARASTLVEMDAPPVIGSPKRDLDLVAPAVEPRIMGIWTLRLAFEWMQGVMPMSMSAWS